MQVEAQAQIPYWAPMRPRTHTRFETNDRSRRYMLDSVSLDHLRMFIAAADEGSFSAGGRRLRSGGLTWSFAPGWSLNPEILYIRDQSNILVVNYSSTEVWINLRKDF